MLAHQETIFGSPEGVAEMGGIHIYVSYSIPAKDVFLESKDFSKLFIPSIWKKGIIL